MFKCCKVFLAIIKDTYTGRETLFFLNQMSRIIDSGRTESVQKTIELTIIKTYSFFFFSLGTILYFPLK